MDKASGTGAARDARVATIRADDIGALERALGEAHRTYEEDLPARVLAGLEAKRAKIQAQLDATDELTARAREGTL
jgi:tRNA A-37 threonylcarbamoyl transferase component Bud32